MAETLKFGAGEWATKKGSTLAYNDENGNFKPLPFNFSRSTSATRVNKQGLIEVVSNNEPRIDFLNDSKGALKLEPSRSNLIERSEEFTNSYWSKVSITVTDDYGVSPSGDLNASRIYSSNAQLNHRVFKLFNFSNTTYTASIYAKSNGSNQSFRMSRYDGNQYFTDDFILTDEWQRYTWTFNSDAFTGGDLWIVAISSVGVGNDLDILVYGAQLEVGSYATSYIPTQGSIGTRVAESCEQTVPDGIINSSEGVLYAEVKALVNESVSKYITLNNGTSTNDRVSILLFEDEMQIRLTVGGVEQVNFSHTPTSITDYNKIAFSFKENESKFFVNGTQIGVTDTSCSTSTAGTLDTLRFDFGNGVAAKFNGKVKDLIVYDTALTDAELATLTTI